MTDLTDPSTYYSDLSDLEKRIDELKRQIAPVARLGELSSFVSQKTHLVLGVVFSTTIQLHSAFVHRDFSSRANCLEAASGILRVANAVRAQEFVFLDSIFGVRYRYQQRPLLFADNSASLV